MPDSDIEIRPFANAAEIHSEAGATLKDAEIAFLFQDLLAIASVAIAQSRTLASNNGFFDHVSWLCGLSIGNSEAASRFAIARHLFIAKRITAFDDKLLKGCRWWRETYGE